ncbi:hypothetical protein [Mucilaginibacter sp. NFX135]|uniref:hypothetical protein n=1 Tax=Mucilaginibacter sp. NFX135 TaxID=3402687 RepID=UPI003AFB56AC
MPYQPDLIPKENSILPDYFNVKKAKSQSAKQKASPLAIFLSIIFIGSGLLTYHYLMIAALLLFCGLSFTSGGKRWMERSGRFTLTPKIRFLFCSTLIILCLPLSAYYSQKDKNEAMALAAVKQRARAFSADSLNKENIRRDSLAVYLRDPYQQISMQSLNRLKSVSRFTYSGDEKENLRKTINQLTLKLVNRLITAGKYEQAVPIIDNELEHGMGGTELLYQRAICNLKSGHTGLAIGDLDAAKNAGYKPAERLYNKVNPIRRRIAYYETLCADGSSSSATGRGACSWHGGVAEWNHPVYEEYRKY